MAKDFGKMEEDNPVLKQLNAAKAQMAKENPTNANDILSLNKVAAEPVFITKEEPAPVKETPVAETSPSAEEKAADVQKTLMNISIRESTKKKWKLFFTEHDLSMTQGIETAVEYLMTEVSKGNIKLSKGGITK